MGEVGECDSLLCPVRGRLSSGSSLPGRGPVEQQQQGRCLITSAHFLAAEVKERAGRRKGRGQSAVRWRAAEEVPF